MRLEAWLPDHSRSNINLQQLEQISVVKEFKVLGTIVVQSFWVKFWWPEREPAVRNLRSEFKVSGAIAVQSLWIKSWAWVGMKRGRSAPNAPGEA